MKDPEEWPPGARKVEQVGQASSEKTASNPGRVSRIKKKRRFRRKLVMGKFSVSRPADLPSPTVKLNLKRYDPDAPAVSKSPVSVRRALIRRKFKMRRSGFGASDRVPVGALTAIGVSTALGILLLLCFSVMVRVAEPLSHASFYSTEFTNALQVCAFLLLTTIALVLVVVRKL